MELLKQHIEALVFCSEQSISLEEIAASLKISFDWEPEDEEIIAALEEIKQKYLADEFSFELVEISEGYQFLTKKQFHASVSALIQHKAKKKLSVSQMETLSIIAYRQPISKGEVEHIRGVSCDYAIQKLLEKELIEISGKSEGPGRPILYSTSKSFMDYFGIKSVKDLPQLKDLHVEQNEIGQPEGGNDVELIPSPHLVQEPVSEIEGEHEPQDFAMPQENELSDMEPKILSEESEFIAEEEDFELENNDLSNLPDRKSIFLENERTLEEEKNSESEDFEN